MDCFVLIGSSLADKTVNLLLAYALDRNVSMVEINKFKHIEAGSINHLVGDP